MKHGSFARAFFGLVFLTLLFSLQASATTVANDNYVGALWVAQSDGVLKLATADGSVLFEIDNAEDIAALALDQKRGVLWAYGRETLTAYAFDGTVVGQYRTTKRRNDHDRHREREDHRREREHDNRRENPETALLAVSPEDGSVWLGTDRELVHLSVDGDIIGTARSKKGITGVAIAPESSTVWVADNDTVYLVDDSNGPLELQELFDARTALRSIQYDEYLQELWVATERDLLRIDNSGTVRFRKKLKHLDLFAPGSRGTLWAASEHRLYKVDASGLVEIELVPFNGRHNRAGRLTAMVADSGDDSLWLANRDVILHLGPDGQLLHEISEERRHKGKYRNKDIRALAIFRDTIAPVVRIDSPQSGSYSNNAQSQVEIGYSDQGIGVDGETLQLFVDGIEAAANCEAEDNGATCTLDAPLPEGNVTLSVTVSDYAGNVSNAAEVSFTVDTIAPEITISSPEPDYLTNKPQLDIVGTVSEPASLSIDGEAQSLGLQNDFSHAVTLAEGGNTFTLIASDLAGNTTTSTLGVTLDTVPPEPAISDLVTVTLEGDSAVVTGQPGAAEPGSWVTVTNATTGESVTVLVAADGSFSARLAVTAGDNLVITVSDGAGNVAAEEATVSTGKPEPGTGYVPPDPAAIAPPIDHTVPTTVYASTAFLYSGSNPIQRGVESGTIEERRVAVLRGKVTTRGGAPLPGVTVTIKDHPEYGWTGTRTDGVFDLSVNGGGTITVNYGKAGYLPVQRQIDAPWRDYVWLPDVVMIPLDEQVTTIDLASSLPMQVAQGSVVTDEDGSRQATILFPQGTQAEMVLPDGTTQPLSTINVRATEYTVGTEGPDTMPGQLPPTSGYTYAVELSVDEAIAAGAKEVRFNRPVYNYVDNFLGFPVGGVVPSGWYDRDKAAWIPSSNGRVIQILSISNGMAVLDVDGGGEPADPVALVDLGISDAERSELAGLYQVGDSLWRIPVTHFTPWDYNWPFGPPDDAERTKENVPEVDKKEDDPDCRKGSIIECQNQVLGESISIGGTPYTINYRSDRGPGRKAAYTLNIPLSGGSLPSSLKRIELEISVAGKRFHQSFTPNPNQIYTYKWDGNDAFKRKFQGIVNARVRVGYVYKAVYYEPSTFAFSFANTGAQLFSKDIQRMEITLWREFIRTVGSPGSWTTGLGGWSLAPLHLYSPTNAMLYRGDGAWRNTGIVGGRIYTIAGTGVWGSEGDGGLATDAQITRPQDMAFGPDGNLYIADSFSNRIRRIGSDGVITTVAGSGERGFSGDGGLATEAKLDSPHGISLGSDGSLYIADTHNHRIRRVSPDGFISTVAGSGPINYWNLKGAYAGDDGLAINARLDRPFDVKVSSDGMIYISDTYNNRIRRVDSNGIIKTVAGTGGMDMAATEVQLRKQRLDHLEWNLAQMAASTLQTTGIIA